MLANGAEVLGVDSISPETEGCTVSGIERLTTAAPRISLAEVIGARGAVVHAHEQITAITNATTRFMLTSPVLGERVCNARVSMPHSLARGVPNQSQRITISM